MMELLEHLRRQFAYDEWANREVLAGLRASARAATRPWQLLAHILSAERLWLERIRNNRKACPCGQISPSTNAKRKSPISPCYGASFSASFRPRGSRRTSYTRTARASRGPAPWEMF